MQNSPQKDAQEIEDYIVALAHDLSEPLQALIADAEVLQYQATTAESMKASKTLSKHLHEISNRTTNILETCILLNRVLQSHLLGHGVRVPKHEKRENE